MTGEEIRIGQRWIFTQGGVRFDVTITDLRLDGDVIHGRLNARTTPDIGANVGGTIICPAKAVRAGRLDPLVSAAPTADFGPED